MADQMTMPGGRGASTTAAIMVTIASLVLPRMLPLVADASGTPVEASATSSGVDANAHSSAPSVDGNGSLIAFESDATNLLANGLDHNGVRDIFVKAVTNGSVSLVSVGSAGTQSNGASYAASIDSAGDLVTYDSVASNLDSNLLNNCAHAQGDCNRRQDVFIHNLRTGTNTLISVAYNGTQSGNGSATAPVISADGSTVVYQSNDSDLTCAIAPCTGERQAFWNIYSYAVRTGVNTLLTARANGDSKFPWPSGDGSRVAIYSTATNLVSSQRSTGTQVFERISSGFTLVSQVSGVAGNGVSDFPMMSPDGGTIVYDSAAANITGSTVRQAVAYNALSHANTVVSACLSKCASGGTAGTRGDRPTGIVYADGNGQRIVFVSNATNVSATAPTDGKRSLFVWSPSTGPVWENVGSRYMAGPAIGSGGSTVAWTSSTSSGFNQPSGRVYRLTV